MFHDYFIGKFGPPPEDVRQTALHWRHHGIARAYTEVAGRQFGYKLPDDNQGKLEQLDDQIELGRKVRHKWLNGLSLEYKNCSLVLFGLGTDPCDTFGTGPATDSGTHPVGQGDPHTSKSERLGDRSSASDLGFVYSCCFLADMYPKWLGKKKGKCGIDPIPDDERKRPKTNGEDPKQLDQTIIRALNVLGSKDAWAEAQDICETQGNENILRITLKALADNGDLDTAPYFKEPYHFGGLIDAWNRWAKHLSHSWRVAKFI